MYIFSSFFLVFRLIQIQEIERQFIKEGLINYQLLFDAQIFGIKFDALLGFILDLFVQIKNETTQLKLFSNYQRATISIEQITENIVRPHWHSKVSHKFQYVK